MNQRYQQLCFRECDEALKRLDTLLPIYRAFADSGSFHFAEAQIARLKTDVYRARTAERTPRELAAHLARLAQALADAVAEWQGEEFYALGSEHDSVARRA